MERIKNILLYSLFPAFSACTEPFPIATIEFDDILVVEGTLTDETKRQEVKLSRTIQLIDFGLDVVNNANVSIEDSNGNMFTFSLDAETQTYLSDIEFQAVQNTLYTLKVETPDGRGYTSLAVELPPEAPIKQVYTEFISEVGKEGVQVFVDSDDTLSDAQYFRYEYEETYKVQLPANAQFDWEISLYDEFTRTGALELSPRDWSDKEFCYPSNGSEGIIQTSTSDQDENRIVRFPIRFIDKGDPVLRRRYSILVKQFVQNLEAFTFYQILEDLGNVESLLSQGQPGFVKGNIVSDTDDDEKVLGYFGASSVSSQRIYFDHTDFGLPLPPYYIECEWLVYPEISFELLKRKLELENFQIYKFDEGVYNGIGPGPIYFIVQSECSECTAYSTQIKPDFWED